MRFVPLALILGVAACGSSDDDAGDAQAALIARGEYLVEDVAACGNCHTPYVNGVPDTTRRLAGVPDRHNVVNVGTVNSANLTPHETGLKSWTDDEIKKSIREGIRKGGEVMWFQMPYYELANLTEEDLSAMVAYLRSIPPVDHALTRRPYTLRTTPFLPITGALVPQTTLPATDANYAKSQRGRYLASIACLHCHTPNAATGDYRRIPEKVFAGNLKFDKSALLPQDVWSKNLTPHENGIQDLAAEQVKQNIKNSGSLLCKPMSTLSTHYLSRMTDEDAMAIGIYLTTLPPNDTGVIATC